MSKPVVPDRSGSGAVDAFLAKANGTPVQANSGRGRLVLALDATASRQPTWDLAMGLQGRMFETAERSGGIDIQLVYFRGFSECRSTSFLPAGPGLLRAMQRISVAAGRTQLNRVLAHVRDESRADHVPAMIFVGDAIEEDPRLLAATAGELALLGTKAFMFQEGPHPAVADVFKHIARVTGGAYAPFDASAPATLGALLSAAAAYSAGGLGAVQAIAGHEKQADITALLAQMR